MARLLTCLVVVFGVIAESFGAETINVGNVRQLLVDDFVVASRSGLVRVVQQPQRVSDEPILLADRPWEGNVLQMPCVLLDPRSGIFHMYYWAAAGADVIFTCYARSVDGMRWDKPTLNLHPGPDGSTENNIVLRGEGRVARTRYVVFNPNTSDPRRRFLALYIDNVPGLTEFAASSPDGLHWTTEQKIGDLRQVTGGDVTANPPFFLIEQQWAKDPGDGHRYRAIWRTESPDMKRWTGGRLVVERLPDDDPDLEFYHATSHFLGSQSHHGLHFGYLYLFHTDSRRGVRKDGVRLAGTVDTSLMVSRDTIRWTRLDRERRFLPLGPDGSWDAGMIYASPQVVVGDRMLFYYSGWKEEHAAAANEAAIGLATLPLDRFVSIEPVEHRGSLTTKPFVVEGERLVLNVDASGGELRVEVLEEEGEAIPGYDASSSNPISTDELRMDAKWRGGSFADLQGRRVRLRFHLTNAKLFAFQVR